MKKNREDVMIPLIRRRREKVRELTENDHSSSASTTATTFCYVDSLLVLEVPDADDTTNNDDRNVISNNKKRKLTEVEMVTACSEFLNAGTDTTTTALQWIMANLVKHPQIQEKLYQDIKAVLLARPRCTEQQEAEVDRQAVAVALKEEDLSKMNYLKAVVLEGLRRHPPAHFVIPHAVTQDVELDGYLFSKDSIINFLVDDFGMNPEVWEDPLQFKPERFLPYLSSGNGFDITGSHDIKMMPFGAGRRICPAYNLAMHHLEYFVANLVWRFEWRSSSTDGSDVDLSEKQDFTTVMKYPLRARIITRSE